MSQPTLSSRYATDCACVVKYFPESRKDSIYFCPLHASVDALVAALERVAEFVFSDINDNEGYESALASLCRVQRQARAALALARGTTL